jgi:hypothetical protein
MPPLKCLVCLAVVALLPSCDATKRHEPQQVSSGPSAKDSITTSKTGTKLEAFHLKTGVVIIRGFSRIDRLGGLYGSRITVEAKEVVDASTGSRQQGITIAVHDAGTSERENTSYVDYDELTGLLGGLDYIGKLDKTVTRLDNWQADYRTKGDLSVSTFSSTDGSTLVSVTSGTIAGTTAYYHSSDLPALRAAIVKAKATLDSLPAPTKQ